MLTINTNLSSLLVQSNLKTSTNGLNTAIERMTTGFKINHAKDNAANYSINTQLSSKLSSYCTAQDNALVGLDMMMTAMDSLDLISSHLTRVRDLAEQAANGTYSESSLNAIRAEVDARLAESSRIISNSEYNGIKLFQGVSSSSKFIEEVSTLTEEEPLAQGYTLIKTADELQAMQDNLSGKYILMNDIDLSGYDWTPIGDSINYFTGEFNGNGFAIKNFTLDKAINYKGLFAYAKSASFTNIAIENVKITADNTNATGTNVGALAGFAEDCNISNCYSSGSIYAKASAGGLIGSVYMSGNITNCYSTCDVIAPNDNHWSGWQGVGGLVGIMYGAGGLSINNCYAAGNVQCFDSVGGLIGTANQYCKINNCYALGEVNGTSNVGGLIGQSVNDCYINNSYAAGGVNGVDYVGGLVGRALNLHTTNSYSQSVVTGSTSVGALFGLLEGLQTSISGSYIYSSFNPTLSAVGDNQSGIDLSNLIDKVTPSVEVVPNIITFQIGIDSGNTSQMSFDLEFTLNLSINITDAESARNSITHIDELLAKINKRQTEFGSAYNRLESALETIKVNIDNLTSTQSTIRDADIAEESSAYIRNQILQQASATLLATANQTPAIALQLL